MPATRIGSGLGLALFGFAASLTQADALAICVDSKALAVQLDECMERGSAVIDKHFQQTQHDSAAVFGFQGRESAAAILCDRSAKGFIFFSVASSDEQFCSTTIRAADG